MIDTNLLKSIPIFNNFPFEELSEIAKITELESYDKDAIVFRENTTGDNLYFILSGIVRIYKTAQDGKTKTLAYLEKGDFFGEMTAFVSGERSASARAMEPCKVAVINNKDLLTLISKNPRIARHFLDTMTMRLREADKQIQALTFQNVQSRLTVLLFDLADRHGKQTDTGILIDFPITHQELANMVGTAREVVSRILTNWKFQGLIDTDKHNIVLKDKAKLAEIMKA